MTETVMNTKILQEAIFRLIPTEKVRVREGNGIVQLMPIPESSEVDERIAAKYAAQAAEKIERLNALRGSGKDLDLTVDSFLAMTHDETEIEG